MTTSMCARQASVQFFWTREPNVRGVQRTHPRPAGRSAQALCRRKAHGGAGGSGGREHVLAQRHVITFVDNDAARFRHIRGSTPSRASAWLLTEHRRHEAELGCFTWFDREPSANAPPDGGRMQLSFNNAQFHSHMGHMTIDESAQKVVMLLLVRFSAWWSRGVCSCCV